MLDAAGPGCIVRFWLTTDQNKQGNCASISMLRRNLRLSFPPTTCSAATSGSARRWPNRIRLPPDSNGGNNFYLPIPYAKHCKITWEEAGNSSRYYQINYRTYAAGTAVRTSTRAALEAARPAVERVNKAVRAAR